MNEMKGTSMNVEEEVLQRYMDMPKFLSLLQTKSLFLAKINGFEDQLEGGLTSQDYLELTLDAKIFDLAMNGAWPGIAPHTPEAIAKRDAITEELKSSEFESIFGRVLNDRAIDFYESARDWVYVSCWYSSPHECAGMWPLYGGKNSLCIQTSRSKLERLLKFPTGLVSHSTISDVQYINHEEDRFEDVRLGPFTSKAQPYSFEKEVRVLAWNALESPLELGGNDCHGVMSEEIDLNELIDRVVVSPNADSWFHDVARSLCEKYGLTAEVIESELKHRRIKTIMDVMPDR